MDQPLPPQTVTLHLTEREAGLVARALDDLRLLFEGLALATGNAAYRAAYSDGATACARLLAPLVASGHGPESPGVRAGHICPTPALGVPALRPPGSTAGAA